jgi:hypothetical protein
MEKEKKRKEKSETKTEEKNKTRYKVLHDQWCVCANKTFFYFMLLYFKCSETSRCRISDSQPHVFVQPCIDRAQKEELADTHP